MSRLRCGWPRNGWRTRCARRNNYAHAGGRGRHRGTAWAGHWSGLATGWWVTTPLWRVTDDARRHNIWEIVLHAAYWKYAVCRKLLNEPRGSFPLKGSNWMKRPVEGADWRSDLALLASTHRKLRNGIERCSTRQLDSLLGSGKVSAISYLSGIAAHDLYHAGQIQLLKRLYVNRGASAKSPEETHD